MEIIHLIKKINELGEEIIDPDNAINNEMDDISLKNVTQNFEKKFSWKK